MFFYWFLGAHYINLYILDINTMYFCIFLYILDINTMYFYIFWILTLCLSLSRTLLQRYHRLVAYKQQEFVSYSSRGWDVQDQGACRLCVWSKFAPWFMVGQLLAVSSHGGRGKGALRGLFYNSTDPICEGSTLMTLWTLKDPSPNTISKYYWRLGFNTWIWGDTNI